MTIKEKIMSQLYIYIKRICKRTKDKQKEQFLNMCNIFVEYAWPESESKDFIEKMLQCFIQLLAHSVRTHLW